MSYFEKRLQRRPSAAVKTLNLLVILTVSLVACGEDKPADELLFEPTNLTQPPYRPANKSEIKLFKHPRIFVNSETLGPLREKLKSVEYQEISGNFKNGDKAVIQAFNYMVWGNQAAGEQAKLSLLEGKIKPFGGLEKKIKVIQLCMLFDWLYPLLDAGEKQRVIERIKKAANIREPVNEKHRAAYYFNDHWARGVSYKTIAALAIHGDDEWASQTLFDIYQNKTVYFSPYDGGVIDVLESMSLNSGGGHQAGITGKPGSGYESMFMIGASLFAKAWESATGEDIVSRTHYFEKLPYYLTQAYYNVSPIGEVGRQLLEYCTGMNSAESAGLAKWMLEREGRAKYAGIFRTLFGDLRVSAKSPEESELPLATYLEGADLVVSRTGWGQEDIALFMFARHWDTSRYEPESGVVSLFKGTKPLLVRGILGKSSFNVMNNSGIWIWDKRKKIKQTLGQGSTYWNKLNNLDYKTTRATSAAFTLDPAKPEYRPETLSSFKLTSPGIIAVTRYEKLLKVAGVQKAERTVTHQNNIVRLTDHLEVPAHAEVLWSARLAVEPKITGNKFETEDMTVVIHSPEVKIYWAGGIGKELIGPTGAWHGDRKHGYKKGYGKAKSRARKYGLGYVFAEPTQKAKSYTFDAEIRVR